MYLWMGTPGLVGQMESFKMEIKSFSSDWEVEHEQLGTGVRLEWRTTKVARSKLAKLQKNWECTWGTQENFNFYYVVIKYITTQGRPLTDLTNCFQSSPAPKWPPATPTSLANLHFQSKLLVWCRRWTEVSSVAPGANENQS